MTRETQYLFFLQMACRECKQPTSDLTHDLCRSHSYCSRQGQYHGAVCGTCEELWYHAQDEVKVDDAKVAFFALKGWIEGFRKTRKTSLL